jgi:hypothetical protein
MSQIKPGDEIGIQCEVTQGPFSDERLVSFDTLDGPVTGFVAVDDLRNTDTGWLVRAVVLSLEDDSVMVRVRGSFLTTNGLASIPRERALAA